MRSLWVRSISSQVKLQKQGEPLECNVAYAASPLENAWLSIAGQMALKTPDKRLRRTGRERQRRLAEKKQLLSALTATCFQHTKMFDQIACYESICALYEKEVKNA